MAKQTCTNPLTISINVCADRFGVDPRQVRALIESGELGAFRLGKRWLIPMTEVEKWIKTKMEGE